MRFVFVMDPLDRVTHDKDTTFAFLRAAQALGHTSFHCLARDLGVEGGDAVGRCTPVEVLPGPPWIVLHKDRAERLKMREQHAVFIRTDPPFDRRYFYLTLVLERARGGPVIVNDPRGLRDANEKLYALNFPELTPRTIVTSDRDRIHAFVAELGGVGIIKPLDGAGGAGVLQLRADDKNVRAIVDTLTHEGTRIAMVQEFLPAVTEGDKRVLLLDGEVLGAILRVPRADELRSNIHVGGSVVPAELTDKERAMVAAMAPRLKQDGLVFVGLDVIGERLTEVNVTSPTGIQELGRFTGTKPEEKVIRWVEERAPKL
ncbi:MAG TPA: glutathione synthase [Byssovorax sp.]|jgi:glutathione synthase